jgi:anthranilate synthase
MDVQDSQQDEQITRYRTPSGIGVSRSSEQVETGGRGLLRALAEQLDSRRGLVLSSTYEVPGRYRQREVGFVDPPLVLESQGRHFTLRALNERGELLLSGLLPALSDSRDFALAAAERACLTGVVTPASSLENEESRTLRPSVLSVVRVLKQALYDAHEPALGLYGALGYDLVFQFEALTQRQPRGRQRELVLYLPDELLVREGERGPTIRHRYEFSLAGANTHALPRSGQESVFVCRLEQSSCDHPPGAFEQNVERAKRAFTRGDLFEVTLSQTFRRPLHARPSQLFFQLQRDNPAPYGFLANLGDGELLIGASPEMYVRVTGKLVETCPIAGTIARGEDPIADAEQVRMLLNSRKDEAELTMCTDVDRNDKARICEPGSVRVVGRRQIELYSRLIHTVDHVQGQLRAGYDAIDALLTHMWAVTVTGAPKLEAMQFIEEHEPAPRRFYAGAVGRIGFDGSLDTGLTLRTAHLHDGVAEVRAGATLLHDSEPEAERRESELKAYALLAALEHCAKPGAAKTIRSARARLPVLLVDHRDSFVHTLADYFRQADCQVTTLRHGFEPEQYDRHRPALVVLSPGPMRPDDFAMQQTLAELRARELTVFGVCLGLQGMVEAVGGALAQLAVPRHGKASELRTRGEHPLFVGLPTQFRVGRYHSLVAERASWPADLTVLAEALDDGAVMALAHRVLPWYAVQFHPESILSARGGLGLRLIENVVQLSRAR